MGLFFKPCFVAAIFTDFAASKKHKKKTKLLMRYYAQAAQDAERNARAAQAAAQVESQRAVRAQVAQAAAEQEARHEREMRAQAEYFLSMFPPETQERVAQHTKQIKDLKTRQDDLKIRQDKSAIALKQVRGDVDKIESRRAWSEETDAKIIGAWISSKT